MADVKFSKEDKLQICVAYAQALQCSGESYSPVGLYSFIEDIALGLKDFDEQLSQFNDQH